MTGPTEVSAREAEVLAALAGGRSNAQIARQLHISVRTVESHISSLLRKYSVSDRRELAGLAELSDTDHRGFTALASPGTTFVGREREQTELLAALGSNRLVSLLGPGGVGKPGWPCASRPRSAATIRTAVRSWTWSPSGLGSSWPRSLRHSAYASNLRRL